jgi:hypothetical protein
MGSGSSGWPGRSPESSVSDGREPFTRTLPRVAGTSVPAQDTSSPPVPLPGQAVTYRPAENAPPAPPAPPVAPRPAVPRTAAPSRAATGRKGPRRARLRLTRIDPWSALKISLVFAAFLFIVWIVAVIVLFLVLQGAGVFTSVNSTLSDVLGSHVTFSGPVIIGGAAVIGALATVIVTALGTIAAFAYNLTAALLGGLDVTLTETD